MLRPVNLISNNMSFRAEESIKTKKNETRLLKDDSATKLKQGYQKTTSALIDYPVVGLKGDVNFNFYQFLTMGIIPYLAGSAMFMLLFNVARKHLNLFNSKSAGIKGNKFALGVVMFGLFKSLSKNLVTKPVKHATGVNIDKPYENVVYNLPTGVGENAEIHTAIEQRKVFDSREFYRKDLLSKEYFDNVAQKLGVGEELNDAESEVSPIIQNIVSTTNMAKTFSSYLWGAMGVMLATQDTWLDFFNSITERPRAIKGNKFKTFANNTVNVTKNFIKSFCKSFAEMWRGNTDKKGFVRHSGKIFMSITALTTIFLTSNAIIRAKNMAKNKNLYTIDESKESVVF